MMEESSRDGQHLVISCTFLLNNASVRIFPLVDTGATNYPFLDYEFATLHSIATPPQVTHRSIEVIDGRHIDSGDVSHRNCLGLHINAREETHLASNTKPRYSALVLGIPWLQAHNVSISFAHNTSTFDSAYFHDHCLPTRTTPTMATGISTPLPA